MLLLLWLNSWVLAKGMASFFLVKVPTGGDGVRFWTFVMIVKGKQEETSGCLGLEIEADMSDEERIWMKSFLGCRIVGINYDSNRPIYRR